MKIKGLIFIVLFLFLVTTAFAQRESQFKREKKRVFKNDGIGSTTDGSKGTLPPDPGGGGGGNPIPISGGALLLTGGLLLYSIKRHKNQKAD